MSLVQPRTVHDQERPYKPKEYRGQYGSPPPPIKASAQARAGHFAAQSSVGKVVGIDTVSSFHCFVYLPAVIYFSVCMKIDGCLLF